MGLSKGVEQVCHLAELLSGIQAVVPFHDDVDHPVLLDLQVRNLTYSPYSNSYQFAPNTQQKAEEMQGLGELFAMFCY